MASEYKRIAALVAEQSIEDKRRLRDYLDEFIEADEEFESEPEEED